MPGNLSSNVGFPNAWRENIKASGFQLNRNVYPGQSTRTAGRIGPIKTFDQVMNVLKIDLPSAELFAVQLKKRKQVSTFLEMTSLFSLLLDYIYQEAEQSTFSFY